MSTERRGLMLVMMDPHEGYDDALNRWYEDEHLAERLSVPGFLSARRFITVEGSPQYLAFYELESPEVLQSEEYLDKKRHPTPLTMEIEAHVDMSRTVYVEIDADGQGGPVPPAAS